MYKYRTIIFDMDGTLFQTDSVFYDAVSAVCVQRGVEPWVRETLVALIGEPMVDICRRVFGSDLTDEEVESIRVEVRRIQGIHMPERGRLYDGARELLQRLREEGYKLCICSNASHQHVDAILENFSLTPMFDIIKTKSEGLSKAQLIKQILDETACCSAIVVGDRIIDIEAAAECCCLSIGVSYGYGGAECEKADFTAHSTMEVYDIINKVNREYDEQYRALLNNRTGTCCSVKLNPVCAEHLEEIRMLHMESEAVEMLGVVIIPEHDFRGDKNNICYSVLDLEDTFIGIIEFFNISWKNRRAEMSIVLKPDMRRMGYGYEAITQLVDIGFAELGFNRIWLRVLEHNTKAIQCYKNVGFVVEGICREESQRCGGFMSQIQMSMLKSEWLNNSSKDKFTSYCMQGE